jgi:Uma2 family endonuclease
MEHMSTLSRHPRRRAGLTRADLEHAPDDGYRYELLDGELLVTPAPGYRHQRIVPMLWQVLDSACPDGLVAMVAPFAVGLAEDTEVQPDVLVAARTAFTETDLPGAPLLVVEVLSPSTRHTDLTIKRDRYERAGIGSYWVIDPAGPSLTAYDLLDGAYVEAASVGPDDDWTATSPFEVTIRPGHLLD